VQTTVEFSLPGHCGQLVDRINPGKKQPLAAQRVWQFGDWLIQFKLSARRKRSQQMKQQITTDPVLDEIHQTRREIAARFDGDFTAMLDDARRRQEASGRPIWKPKRDEQGGEMDG